MSLPAATVSQMAPEVEFCTNPLISFKSTSSKLQEIIQSYMKEEYSSWMLKLTFLFRFVLMKRIGVKDEGQRIKRDLGTFFARKETMSERRTDVQTYWITRLRKWL